MGEPLALVVSDLHFGEVESVLSISPAHPARRDEAIGKFIELVKGVLDAAGQKEIPYLIMAGDTLDLSVAPMDRAVAEFRYFLETVDHLFGGYVIIPGNHDHHLWVSLQEQVYVINRIQKRETVEKYPHEQKGYIRVENGSHRLDLPGVSLKESLGSNTYLQHLVPPGSANKNFALVYPNLVIEPENEDGKILITHGHFFQPAWTIITDMFKTRLRHHGLGALNYQKLEELNSPTTEFGWYNIGQAGEFSDMVETAYDELRQCRSTELKAALKDVIRYLHGVVKKKKKPGYTLARALLLLLQKALPQIVPPIIKSIIKDEAGREGRKKSSGARYNTRILTDPETRPKIAEYLVMYDGRGSIPKKVIFGHTHIPFKGPGGMGESFTVGKEDLKGAYIFTPEHVGMTFRMFNTGGWLKETGVAGAAKSRPLPFLVYTDGNIEGLHVDWANIPT